MKRISDLLDDYQEDSVVIQDTAPLSKQRIKKMTMNKIRARRKWRPVTFLSKAAAVAAVLSMLAVTAVAVEYIWSVKDWFGYVFTSRADQIRDVYERNHIDIPVQGDMTEAQLAVLESMGQMKNETVICEGSSITLTAVCSDEYVMHLYFQVEAPEGTVLPDGLDYNFEMTHPGTSTNVSNGKQIKRPILYVEGKNYYTPKEIVARVLPDEDPTDNKKDFHLIIVTGGVDANEHVQMNDGIKKSLTLYGLFTCEKVDGKETYQNIVPGEFVFDITNQMPAQWIDVDVEGLAYDQEFRTNSGTKTYPVEAKKLRISPLSAQWESMGHILVFDIVMKDGTQAVGLPGTPGFSRTEGEMSEVKGFKTFYLPVDLNEIDYVLINDEKIYVDQEDKVEQTRFSASMSEGQLAALEAMGQVKSESITSNGATITLQALCSDEYVMYLYFDVVAPEGVILADDLLYTFRSPRENNITLGERKNLSSYEMYTQALPDDDPTDNKKSFQLEITSFTQKMDHAAKLNDGVKKTLNINGLYIQKRDAQGYPSSKVEQTLFEGEFNFDITNEVESKRIDVDVKGYTYEYPWPGYWEGEQPESGTIDVVAESLRIGPLTAEWVGTGPGYFDIYMKDGTKAFKGSGWQDRRDGKSYDTRLFYLPIDLNEIDYVLIGATHKVYVDP